MPQRRMVIFTGAGISAGSGLATFRGSGGLWHGHDVDEVCNGYTWWANRGRVHDFYNARRLELADVAPNPAHLMVARMQDEFGAEVITTNIDDLHERAAEIELVTRGRILHAHGCVTQMSCVQCREPWEIGHRPWDPAVERCPRCGTRRLVRPNVVFFEEEAPNYRRMHNRLDTLTENDVLLVIGTSGSVVPIGRIAKRSRARTMLANLTAESDLVQTDNEPNFDETLFGPAESLATEIERRIIQWMAVR